MSQQESHSNENNKNVVKVSTFADTVDSKRTPFGNALQKPLQQATGTIFKLLSGVH